MVRNWNLGEFLSSNQIYKGPAKVSFSTPNGEVSGPATLTIPSNGHITLEIEIQQHSIPPEYNNFLMPFMLGRVPEQIAGGAIEFRDRGGQKIKEMGVQTRNGTFRASRGIVTKRHFNMFSNGNSSITVVPNDLMFVPSDQVPEEVWCLPLFGNLTEFRGAESASSIADQAPFIPFCAEGALCGLEIFDPPIKTPSKECAGVAFGSVGDRPHDTADEVRKLLPDGLMAALSFTSGSDVNSPFVELRSHDGMLGRRVHLRMGGTPHKNGFPALTWIDGKGPDSGIAAFLRCFFGLSPEGRAGLIVPLSLVRNGTPGRATVDESITDLVKALDSICKIHGLNRRNLRANLTANESAEIRAILDDARSKLKELRKKWKKDHKLPQLPILDRIIGRQANVDSADLDFGLSLTDLLHRLGLSDSEAMNAYYSALPQDVTWEGLLSTVRGEVIHSEAIHIRNSATLVSWYEFARHLHDISKRILLKEVGYTGTYAPSNVLYKGQYAIDRVKPTTSVEELGYSQPPVSI